MIELYILNLCILLYLSKKYQACSLNRAQKLPWGVPAMAHFDHVQSLYYLLHCYLTLHLSICMPSCLYKNYYYWSKLWPSKTGFYEVKNLFFTSKDKGAGPIYYMFVLLPFGYPGQLIPHLRLATSLFLLWFLPSLQI